MIQEERRLSPRYRAPESLVATAVFPAKREQRLRVKDISIEGLSFTTEMDISNETILNLSIETTDEEGRPVRLDTLANILWYTFDKNTLRYCAGVLFVGFKNADRELLRKILGTMTPRKRR